MRVLQFLSQYPGRDGTSAYGTGLATAMNRRWQGSCPILSLRSDRREAPPGVEVICFPRHSRNPFGLPGELLAALRENRPGIHGVVLHGTYNPPVAALAWRLRRWRIPYIFMPHDPYVAGLTEDRSLRKKAYFHLMERPVLNGARAVQLLDEAHEEPLRRLGYRGEVFFTPNGCDPATLSGLTGNERVPGSADGARFLYLGRLDSHHKGLDILLEGFSRFIKNEESAGKGAVLALTGNDWTDRKPLERLAADLGMADRVVFTGARKEPSLQIHAEADVVILPSRFDGFGLTIMEAMLASRPVMVSRMAGVSRHVDLAGGGELMDCNAESVAAAFGRMITRKPEWEAMGRRNHDYVTGNLTWDQVAERTREAYVRYFKT